MLPRNKRGGLLMRILAPFMLALVVSVFLASCGGQEAPVEETEVEGSAEETSIEETTTEDTSDRAKTTIEESTTSAEVAAREDRKSTRLNSSHANISYAVFCLKKKKKKNRI